MNIIHIPFYGDEITVLESPERDYVALRPICERLGLDWSAQFRRLNRAPERWSVAIMATETAAGQRETCCIPRSKLAGWLASLDANRVKPEHRAALIRYQNEADMELDRHFRLRHAAREDELAYLKAQQARMRAFTLAFNPLWNKISRLQQAGIGRRQVWGMFGGRTRNYIDVTIEHMEGAGVIQSEDWDEGWQPEDWNKGFVPPSFEAPTPIEAMQHEMAFGESPNA